MSSKPILKKRDLKTLHSKYKACYSFLRKSNNNNDNDTTHHECSGSLVFNARHVDVQWHYQGDDERVTVGPQCHYCVHTHPAPSQHPYLLSPPSLPDLMVAYDDPNRVHLLLSREGLYVFYRVTKRPVAEALVARGLTLRALRNHALSNYLTQSIVHGVKRHGHTLAHQSTHASPQSWRRFVTRCVLATYMHVTKKDMGVHVAVYPWSYAKPIVLP